MIKIKYVQFEPGAALTDSEVVSMTDKQYRAYWELIWYLYCNGGKCEADLEILAPICHCEDVLYFSQKVWPKIKKKFQIKKGFVRHKRVTKELRKAQKRAQAAKIAGLASGKSRRTSVERPLNDCPTNENETKPKAKENNITNKRKSFSQPSSTSASLRFNDSLQAIIHPRTTGDRTAFRNLTIWLDKQILEGKKDEGVYGRVLGIAEEAAKKGRIPPAMFFDILKREMDYVVKGGG